MEIELEKILSFEKRRECYKVAYARMMEQRRDAETDFRANYSYGVEGIARDIKEHGVNHMMGAFAECIGSIYFKCHWSKEMGQYKGNKNPDLKPVFKGKELRCDVRGTGSTTHFLSRKRDATSRDDLLFVVTNMPKGPICTIGYIYFNDLVKIVKDHPEWEGKHPGAPYFLVPIEYLTDDFSEFGK